MKKLALLTITVALLLFTGCKNQRPDMTGLLKTVPSSAAAVVGIHLQSLAEDAGCKITDNEIKPGKEVKAMMEKMSDSDRAELLNLFSGSSGIVPDYALTFVDANRAFLTLSLYDVKKFKEFVKKDKESEFTDAGNGVQICKNVAIKDNQAWICLSTSKQIDADAIAAYAGLSKSQSFLNTDMAKVILESDCDVIGWGNFKTLVSSFLSRKNMSGVMLASGFLFEDVDAVQFSLDFDKGEMEASALFLDDEGKPAKYLLPAEKIDIKAVKELGGSCDGVLAFTINPKLVQKIEKVSSSLGGAMFGDIKETLKNIDGTVAISIGMHQEAVNGLITTKGKVSNQLNAFLSMMTSNVEPDGKYLRFSKGNVTGGLSIDECADLLKGYSIGLAADLQGMQSAASDYGNLPSSLSTFAIGLEPYSGSLRLSIELKTADDKENFLLSVIKAM